MMQDFGFGDLGSDKLSFHFRRLLHLLDRYPDGKAHLRGGARPASRERRRRLAPARQAAHQGPRQRGGLRQRRGQVPPAAARQRQGPDQPLGRHRGPPGERFYSIIKSYLVSISVGNSVQHVLLGRYTFSANGTDARHCHKWGCADAGSLPQLLEAVGFRAGDGVLALAADADLGPLTAALARLRRLADNKGHSGEAEFFPLPGGGGGSNTTRVPGASPLLVSSPESVDTGLGSRVLLAQPPLLCMLGCAGACGTPCGSQSAPSCCGCRRARRATGTRSASTTAGTCTSLYHTRLSAIATVTNTVFAVLCTSCS